ncbi:uncharacterized protein FIBRA_08089 [Fibroporia radiculosa]|uniref:Ketoreductase (KR) domain-containing protein n=1 Tax=Fibroporia radiculosa TaxID=599839 RepID=J4GGE9_9APHY|nr:uncharacterized protein FIBRA_08089 [Fibroporia radiculosa]CCM05853.1 predicted protein [Fibroporia radiculosa]
MPPLSIVRAANAAYSPLRPPVAIFLGGTSGIGQGLAKTFARYTKGDSHIIMCGRNRAAAEAMITSLPKAKSSYSEFLACDATSMKGVEATTSNLLSRLPKVNFLFLSPGFLNFRGRNDTSEGIDKWLALTYYARWKFIYDLLPLLTKAKEAGEDARVLTVLGPGTGGRIDLDDLGLKRKYSSVRAFITAPTYNDLMIESFAEREPGVSFTHVFPGIVRTPMLGRLLEVLLYPIGDGASRRNNKGDDMGKKRYYGSDESRKRLWEHTVQEVDRAKKSGV